MTAIRRLTTTRQGTLALAGVAALLALGTLMAFLHGYKKTLADTAQPVTVLVAKEELPKGSSGDLIARKGLFQAVSFKRDQVKDGAITDPGSLSGMVAVHDIVRGQQLTTGDFAKPTDPVLSKLGADERAISIPLDSAHGIIGRVAAGDRVDVLAGFQVQPDGATRPRPILRTLLQNVEVLQAPPTTDTAAKTPATPVVNQTQNIVLKVPEKDMGELAFSSDNGKVWIALRPQAGAAQHQMTLVTLDRLLLGMDPIPVDRFLAHKRSLINKIYRGDL